MYQSPTVSVRTPTTLCHHEGCCLKDDSNTQKGAAPQDNPHLFNVTEVGAP